MLIMKAPQNADQKPCIWIPRLRGPDNFTVISSMRAFTIRVKRPSVRIIRGKAKRVTRGLIKELIIPKTAPIMIIFHHSPLNVRPSTIFTATAMESALIIIRRMKYETFMGLFYLYLYIFVQITSGCYNKHNSILNVTEQPGFV